MTRRWILLLYLVPALILAVGSLPFLFGDLDLEIAHKYYNESAEMWTKAKKAPWIYFYKYGPVPAILTAALAFSILVLSIGRPKLAPYRKIAAFMALALILGPGVMVNSILKENWGRPRPREVEGLGGQDKFEPLLTIDKSSDGASFVSGHASMGFYFFSCGLALLACGRRKTGTAVIVVGGTFGYFIGMARIVQGGHFASDVLWSAAAVWFTSAALFHAFGLHRKALYEPKKPVGENIPRWLPLTLLFILLTAIGTTCFAFPYDRIKKTTLISEELDRLPDIVLITLDLEGALELSGGDALLLETESRGIGFPRARLKNDRIFVEDGSEVVHHRSGFFTKLNVRTRVTLPPNRTYKITLGQRVTSVVVLPPGEHSESGHFALVRLTSGLKTKLLNIRTKPLEEDFFGRKTRAFRVE